MELSYNRVAEVLDPAVVLAHVVRRPAGQRRCQVSRLKRSLVLSSKSHIHDTGAGRCCGRRTEAKLSRFAKGQSRNAERGRTPPRTGTQQSAHATAAAPPAINPLGFLVAGVGSTANPSDSRIDIASEEPTGQSTGRRCTR